MTIRVTKRRTRSRSLHAVNNGRQTTQEIDSEARRPLTSTDGDNEHEGEGVGFKPLENVSATPN